MPSSSSWAHTWAGARSQYSSDRSTDRTCWRSGSVSLFGDSGRGAGGPSSGGRRRRSTVARLTPSSSHACLVDIAFSSAPRCSAVTASTWSRCPRSRRAAPRARALSRDLQRRLRPLELGREAFVVAAEPVQLELLGRSPLARLAGQTRAGAGFGLLAPLEDVRRVQALAAQDRTSLLGALRPRVVLGYDLSLVLGAECSSRRLRRLVDVVVGHAPSVGTAVQRSSRHGHGPGVPVSPRRVR